MKFNEEQLLAITHFNGPCMYLAGPGSGKNTIIVNRIRFLNEKGVSFGTFHSLFFKIIRYAYNYDISSILSEDERLRFLKEAAERTGIDTAADQDFIFSISNDCDIFISLCNL